MKTFEKSSGFFPVFERKSGPAKEATHYCPGCGHGQVSDGYRKAEIAGVLALGTGILVWIFAEMLDEAECLMMSIAPLFGLLGGDVADVIEPMRRQSQVATFDANPLGEPA